jgi:hypothetical protein
MRGLGLAVAVAAMAACAVPRVALGPQHARPSPAAATGSIDAFVPEAVRFVEAHRGLKFKRPVKVHQLSDQAFQARVIELQRQDPADTIRQGKVLRALGLLPPGIDPEKAEEELLGGDVIGFYDPKTRELEVRGDAATLHVKHVVVHELTHALQDQWFGLPSQSSGNDDADFADTTLIEGDAVRVEDAYIASLSAQDRQRLRSEEAGGNAPIPGDVPRVLEELLGLPYSLGPAFTSSVLAARGQAGLDDAFRMPPTSSSQVLHPDRYLAGAKPAKVADPPADGPTFDRGTLGELDLDLLLEGLVGSGALTGSQARAATQGWSGDRYVAWAQGSGFCVRDRLATLSAADGTALMVALRAYAASRPGVTVDAGPEPVLTSCA